MGALALSWYSYLLVGIIFLFSTGIGIYFGCFNKKKSSKNEYILGGGKMKAFPVAVSLVSSACSTDFLLAITTDVYRYGAAMFLRIFTMIILCVVTIYVYMPVFFDLKVTTTYKYLELRFDRRTRLLVSFIFSINFIIYLALVIYVPSLALSTVTGVKTHTIAIVVSGVCIFYTSIGGLKTVVWTDTVQFLVVASIFIAFGVLGVETAGGLSEVWTKAVESGRLDIFDFDPDPTKRDSFWAIVIGSTINLMSYTSVDQSAMQKLFAVSTFREASLALIYYCIGLFIVQSTFVFFGLIIYAKYGNCDPVSAGIIERNDQLLLLLVMDIAVPGFTGLFIIAIFAASLSAQSAIINCIAGTIHEDFLSKLFSNSLAESKVLKLTAVAVGVLSTCLIFLIEKLGDLFPLMFGLISMSWGPILGVFTLGLTCPKANSRGAVYGSLCGFAILLIISVPATYYESHGLISYPTKPLSTEGCISMNSTVQILPSSEENVAFIFRISFYYYTLIGSTSTIIAGVIISYLTNKNDPPIDRSLVSPVCQFLVSDSDKKPAEEQVLEDHTNQS